MTYQRVVDQVVEDRRHSAQIENKRNRQRVLVGIMQANVRTLCELWISDIGKQEATYNAANSLLLCAVEIIAGWKVRTK